MLDKETIKLYDILGQLNSPVHHIGGLEATKELLNMLEFDRTSNVLDVGCGSGNTACYVSDEYGCRVIGIDASEVMIQKAQERVKKKNLEDKVKFRLADVFDLPFQDSTFNIVLFESILNVITTDRLKALTEIVRVLQPGGMVGGNEVIVFSTAPEELKDQYRTVAPFLGYPLKPQELKALFKSLNLQEIEQRLYPSSKITNKSILREIRNLMGITGLLSYIGKMLYYYFRFSELRHYSKSSRMVLRNKDTKGFFGYAFIIGRKMV